jgi:hypothetical protein
MLLLLIPNIFHTDPSILYAQSNSTIGGGSSGGGGGSGSNGGRCLIATAAFGSELAPQVQFLRNFRQEHILSTVAGSSFMTVFNAWYYSFSPYVADYEREHPWLQQIVRTTIYPLLGILLISQKAYYSIPGEYGAVVAGWIASTLIGAAYFSPFALLMKRVRKGNLSFKLVGGAITASLVAVIGSVVVANNSGMMVTTTLFVLITAAFSAIIGARMIVKSITYVNKRMINQYH